MKKITLYLSLVVFTLLIGLSSCSKENPNLIQDDIQKTATIRTNYCDTPTQDCDATSYVPNNSYTSLCDYWEPLSETVTDSGCEFTFATNPGSEYTVQSLDINGDVISQEEGVSAGDDGIIMFKIPLCEISAYNIILDKETVDLDCFCPDELQYFKDTDLSCLLECIPNCNEDLCSILELDFELGIQNDCISPDANCCYTFNTNIPGLIFNASYSDGNGGPVSTDSVVSNEDGILEVILHEGELEVTLCLDGANTEDYDQTAAQIYRLKTLDGQCCTFNCKD